MVIGHGIFWCHGILWSFMCFFLMALWNLMGVLSDFMVNIWDFVGYTDIPSGYDQQPSSKLSHHHR